MNCFLDAALASRRRGRFLGTLLDAVPVTDGLPEAGLLLMEAKDFQAGADEQQAELKAWTARPGRVLLLLPPFETGVLSLELDWRISFRDDKPLPVGSERHAGKGALGRSEGSKGLITAGIANGLRDEVLYAILGRDGDCDRAAGHCWGDGIAHTRYLKAHSGSGLFAATCLPLWSVSLLDQARPTLAWLAALYAQTGPAVDNVSPNVQATAALSIDPEAFSLLVCLYGFDCADAEGVLRRLEASLLPIVDLPRSRLPMLWTQLQTMGYVDGQGLTTLAQRALQDSPYWPYAQRLREDLREELREDLP